MLSIKKLGFEDFRQHGQQHLYLQYKKFWIPYKIVGAASFLQSYLRIQPPLQSPTKNRSFTSFTFHLLIPPFLDRKIILTINNNSPFLYISTFQLPIIYTKKYFPHLRHLANSGCIKG